MSLNTKGQDGFDRKGCLMKNNLNPLSASGTINRKTYFFTELILWLITGTLSQMAENQAGYMTGLGVGLYFVVVTILILSMAFAAIKRCREVGISTWWAAGMFVPILSFILTIYLSIAKANAEKNPYLKTSKEPEPAEEISPIESVDDSVPSHRSAVQPVSYGEAKRSDSQSLWEKLSGPLTILLCLAYLAYGLVAFGLFSGFICWWLDIDNFLLECLATVVGLIAISIVPFAGWIVLAGSAYYAAEVLRWGWPLAILFVFPGLGFMLLAGVGSLVSTVANKLRR